MSGTESVSRSEKMLVHFDVSSIMMIYVLDLNCHLIIDTLMKSDEAPPDFTDDTQLPITNCKTCDRIVIGDQIKRYG